MRPRVKLLTPWVGRKPYWLPHFKRRLAASARTVAWEMVPFLGLAEIRRAAEDALDAPCRKGSAYAALCDLRPFYAVIFEKLYCGYDYWGWCDVDIVFGDLDRFFLETLDRYDVISLEYYALCGGMTAFRACDETRCLWLDSPWREVLAEPAYCNFDEGGYRGRPAGRGGAGAGGFTGVVNASGLRAIYDDRSWSEGRSMTPDGRPSRTCYLDGRRLIERPTEREIFLYHLGSKRWPNLAGGDWEDGPPRPPRHRRADREGR